MGLFFNKRKEEVRADTVNPTDTVESEALLSALLGEEYVTRNTALQIPSVQNCINLIAGTISSLPIKLYKKENDGSAKEITDDKRVFLLNNDTGDTLTATQFWRAIIEDYFLGKGGYAYINRSGNDVVSIHYVDEKSVFIMKNEDPIFKSYDIYVCGKRYYPYEFVKFLRKTKDGMTSTSIQEESPLILSVSRSELKFEEKLVKKDGNKRGYLLSEKSITKEAIERLKEAFRRLYSGDENVIVLNNGLKFQESSNTSVEMQLNENKKSNASEICKLFGIPESIITGGNISSNDMEIYIRTCMSIINDFECSLDRDLLLESEKESYYFAFDTKELTRGNIKDRYEAYATALRNNFMQIDEVRNLEDLEPLGVNWITLGLDTVLYDLDSGQIYTPNTNAVQDMNNIQSAFGKNEERAYSGKNLIVTGAPGSGKTTWVNDVRNENDLVIDLDAIKSALWGSESFHAELTDKKVEILISVRDSLYESVSDRKNESMCYIITTENDPGRLDSLKEKLHAELKVMDTPKEECIKRVMSDDTRPNKGVFLDLIEKWYERGEIK